MKQIVIIILFVSSFLLVSCGVKVINFADTYKINKNTNVQDFLMNYEEFLDDKFYINFDNKEYSVFSMRMATEQVTTTTGSGQNRVTTTTIYYTPYYIIFHNEKFHSSGFVYEYMRHSSQLFREIAYNLKNRVKVED